MGGCIAVGVSYGIERALRVKRFASKTISKTITLYWFFSGAIA